MSQPDRLLLLRDTHVISADVYEAIAPALEGIRAALAGPIDGETGQMFVTHLAMAAQRATQGEALNSAPENLAEELKGREAELQLAANTLSAIEERLGVSFPDAEIQLVAIYLATLSEEPA